MLLPAGTATATAPRPLPSRSRSETRPSPELTAMNSSPPEEESERMGRLLCVPSHPPYAPTLQPTPLMVALSPEKLSPHLNSTRLPLPMWEELKAVLKLEVLSTADPAGQPAEPATGVLEAATQVVLLPV